MFYPYTSSPQKIANLKTTNDRGVYGVACLHDRVFILTQYEEIDVYRKNASQYRKLRGIQISELVTPSDVAACKIKGRLYISDSRNYGIWQVRRPLDANAEIKKFVEVRKAKGLSVTPDGRLVVITEVPHNIFVYLPDRRLSMQVSLSNLKIEAPFQAVLNEDDQFILCSGLTKNQSHKVLKISSTGLVQVRK